MKRAAGAFAFGLVLLAALEARASDPSRIAVTAVEGHAALSLRLAAELAAIGYVVVPLDAEEAADGAVLGQSLERSGSAAALTIDVAHGATTACVVEEKTLLRTCRVVAQKGEHVDDSTVATRAAELVRTLVAADVVETKSASKQAVSSVAVSPATTAAELPPEPDDASAASPIEPKIEARIGPGVILPNGVPAELAAGAGADWLVTQRFALGLDAMIPITSSSIVREQGSASVRATTIGGRFDVRYATGHWETELGAGLGLMWMQVNGTTATPLLGVTDSLVDPYAQLHAALGAFVTRALSVRIDVLGGYVLSHAVIRFAGQDVAQVGRPLAMSTVSLSFSWE